jgi:peroxiredoxin
MRVSAKNCPGSTWILLLEILGIAALFFMGAPHAVGQRMPARLPDFQFKLLDGSTVRSADLRGKIAVIDFWGTWCRPCLKEIPDYNALFREYRERGVVLLALAMDSGTESEVRAAVKKLGIEYPVGAPALPELEVFGDIAEVPTTWVADGSGKVVQVFLGTGPGKQKALREIVDGILKR